VASLRDTGIRLSKLDISVQAAGAWFLRSGIQAESGGVARYYYSDLHKNARVSTEVTGYTISTLLFLYQRTGKAAYLDAALRAAHFLTRTAWDARLSTFPFEYCLNGDGASAFAYFFDCGIIVRSLLSAWRVSGENEFRDTAIAAGCAMLSDFLARDAIHPIVALPDKFPTAYEARWSARPGCYQLKAALAWRELFETTGDVKFLDAYESSLSRALASAEEFLPGDPDPEKVMDRLHAYLYFLEGLVPILDRSDCANTFRRGLSCTSEYLREIAPMFARSDVYAQLLRARLYGENRAAIILDFDAAAEEAGQVSTFQVASDDPRLAGGFLFGSKRGAALPFMNPVSTSFCLQVLALWEDRKNDRFVAGWEALI
jgi:hypothetical protein